MRVISGSARGLKLTAPQGTDTRPTLDRVKEAVFSMLLPYLNEASVLDLFAGSGAMGIEALSRGAKDVTFVDNSQKAISCIKTNVSAARMCNSSDIIMGDAEKFLSGCNKKFDLIFLDPPYANDLYSSILHAICESGSLAEDGMIIAEWDFEIGFTRNLYGFEIFKEKKYGRVGITVLKWGST